VLGVVGLALVLSLRARHVRDARTQRPARETLVRFGLHAVLIAAFALSVLSLLLRPEVARHLRSRADLAGGAARRIEGDGTRSRPDAAVPGSTSSC
jgi:hypothetical protein